MFRFQALITFIIASGSLLAIVSGRDFFPFSNYPMYSKIFEPGKEFKFRRIVGINLSSQEVRIEVPKYLPPFWSSSLHEAVLVDRNPAKVAQKLKSALKVYNKNLRAQGMEPLKSIRLYEFKTEWELLSSRILQSSLSLDELYSRQMVLEVEE